MPKAFNNISARGIKKNYIYINKINKIIEEI